jgi:hypothetical protein
MCSDLRPVRLEATLYFQRNPFARETVGSLALRLGRPEELVESVLTQLVESMIVERRGNLYRYRRPYMAAEWDETTLAR